MRIRRPLLLTSVILPLVLLQLDLSSCIPAAFNPNPPTSGGGGPTFNLPPTVVIGADLVRGIAPLTVQFTSSGSSDDGLIVSRTWDFGDGQSSPDISPQHTFQSTGEFQVTLTLTDDSGTSASRSITISVTRSPVAVIEVDRTAAATSPAIFAFDASSSFDPDGEIDQYRWDFGDGSREFLPVVAHTFVRSGTFRVRLTVTDNTGVTNTVDQIIEVGIPRPRISFRVPPRTVENIVVSPDSPLWIATETTVTSGVSRMVRAGLDGDADPCNAQSVLFNAQTGDELVRLTGHTDQINTSAISPDGNFVLTGSNDRTVRLYAANTGELIYSVGGVSAAVTSLAFSPGGGLFVQGTLDGRVLLRNTGTGSILREFAGHGVAVNSVAFSPTGDRVASASEDRTARVWNANSGALVAELAGHTFSVTAVAFSPDGSRVATGSVDQTARTWNAASGTLLRTFTGGHTNSVTTVAVSPDGTQLLTGGDDRRVVLWDMTTGAEITNFAGHTGRIASGSFSPTGLEIITGSFDGSARVWDVATAELMRTLRPCSSTVSAVQFSADGSTILTGVAAKNDIQLDTNPGNGNDLNSQVPVALDLSDVPPGNYALWAEVDTDRTDPVRTYSDVVVNVTAPFTANIEAFTPTIPLVNDQATIVVESDPTKRQIFDLGPLSAGDRIFLSLLTTPGYDKRYSDDLYSLMILDENEQVFAWYQDRAVLLTEDARLIVGHNSQHYYVVSDTGDSIDVRIQRGVGTEQRLQRIFLDFRGRSGLQVADLEPFSVPELRAVDLNMAWGDTETTIVRNQIVQTVRDLFAPWNVDITSSDDGAPPPPPYMTVYVGGSSPDVDIFGEPLLYGIADYIDPRNETLTGTGYVGAIDIATDNPAATPMEMGMLIGCVTAHEIGHLVGLRHVDNDNDIMNAGSITGMLPFANSPLRAFEIPQGAIGMQDAVELFDEIFGRR